MSEIREVEIPAGIRRDRADKVLSELVEDLSRSRIQKLIEEGAVWRDDQLLVRRSPLEAGDLIRIEIPQTRPLEVRPVAMALNICYEDSDILVLNKPSGVVVHPGAGTGEDTLVHGLLHHCAGQLSGIGGVERPGIVHRLDKETSGLLVVAKNDRAHHGLVEQFQSRSIRKVYTALLQGQPDWRETTVDRPIGRHPVQRMKMAVRDSGRNATSHFEVLHAELRGSLARIQIETGRTHQIRVHAKFLGHPVVGDELYGYRGDWKGRILLHAGELEFTHPCNGNRVQLSVGAPFGEERYQEG